MHHDKATGAEKQSLLKRWSEELAEKLPGSLEESAKKYGAIVRKREIKSALGLLQAMLMYAVSDLAKPGDDVLQSAFPVDLFRQGHGRAGQPIAQAGIQVLAELQFLHGF